MVKRLDVARRGLRAGGRWVLARLLGCGERLLVATEEALVVGERWMGRVIRG